MVELEVPKAPESARGCLEGYPEEALWRYPEVATAAELIWGISRSPFRVRWVVAGMRQFLKRMDMGTPELFVRRCRDEPGFADLILWEYWQRFTGRGRPVGQVLPLWMGAMLFMRCNDIHTAWSPKTTSPSGKNGSTDPLPFPQLSERDRFVLTSLTACNVVISEMVALQLADVGEIDGSSASWHPNLGQSAPAVRVRAESAEDGKERITFLSYDAGRALNLYLAERREAGHSLHQDSPLVADHTGRRTTVEGLGNVTKRMDRLLEVTRELNVDFCIGTGKALRARRKYLEWQGETS